LRKFLIIFFFLNAVYFTQSKTDKISSMPGSFSRMGFGARGMGMGNAVSSVINGNLVSYYNPAITVFQERNSVQLSYSILSLDRSLNFLNFTRRFDFRSNKDSAGSEPRSTAGFSLGIINKGVSKIDGRDNQGIKTGELTESENQFFLSVANKFSKKFSLGIAIKFYYYKLYEKINSTGLGFDIGALYRISNHLNLSLMLSDLNSKYKWDTSPIYDQEGNNTQNKFPTLKKIGLSYKVDKPSLIAAVELESSNAETNYLRLGAEYNIFDQLYLRTGIDRWNLKNSEIPVKPSFGFSYSREIDKVQMGIDYAFIIEPYSPTDQHIIGINISF
jgi:hypothetical protein